MKAARKISILILVVVMIFGNVSSAMAYAGSYVGTWKAVAFGSAYGTSFYSEAVSGENEFTLYADGSAVFRLDGNAYTGPWYYTETGIKMGSLNVFYHDGYLGIVVKDNNVFLYQRVY